MLQHVRSRCRQLSRVCNVQAARLCNVLTHLVLTHPHTATRCNILIHTATHCNTLQHTATHCNTVQQMAAANIAINGLWNVHLYHLGAGNTLRPLPKDMSAKEHYIS